MRELVSVGLDKRLERRVARAADEALAARGRVTAIDVLTGLGWLHPVHEKPWRQRRVPDLEQLVQVGPEKIASALELLAAWATAHDLEPREAEYVARSRGREPLRFSAGGEESVERRFRTHWLSPELSDRERARLTEPETRPAELVVISPLRPFTCSACQTESDGLLIMEGPGPVCMACAELDHLAFLPSGDAALTRRAKAGSGLWAVVVRFSRARRRYERQGLPHGGGASRRSAGDRAGRDRLGPPSGHALRRAADVRRRARGRPRAGSRPGVARGGRMAGCRRPRTHRGRSLGSRAWLPPSPI